MHPRPTVITCVVAILGCNSEAPPPPESSTMDNAAIYLSKGPPSIDWLKQHRHVDNAEFTRVDNDATVTGRYILLVGDVKVTLNVMRPENMKPHLKGFAGYVRGLGEKSSPNKERVLRQISQTKFVMGCLIEPGFDEAGNAETVLLDIAGQYDGFVFAYDTVHAPDGSALIGP